MMQDIHAFILETIGPSQGEAMIKAYLEQTRFYFSESKQEFVTITDMPYAHRRNAAEKLMRDADYWGRFLDATGRHPRTLVSLCPLVMALLGNV